ALFFTGGKSKQTDSVFTHLHVGVQLYCFANITLVVGTSCCVEFVTHIVTFQHHTAFEFFHNFATDKGNHKFLLFYRKCVSKSARLNVSQRNSHSVGCVVRLGHGIQSQKHLDHLLNLFFFCTSVPCHSLFDLQWRVFVQTWTVSMSNKQQ